jgi:hypothetical protein
MVVDTKVLKIKHYKGSKSEILLIGIGTISVTEKIRYGLTICEKEILLLGVYIGKDQIVIHLNITL